MMKNNATPPTTMPMINGLELVSRSSTSCSSAEENAVEELALDDDEIKVADGLFVVVSADFDVDNVDDVVISADDDNDDDGDDDDLDDAFVPREVVARVEVKSCVEMVVTVLVGSVVVNNFAVLVIDWLVVVVVGAPQAV